MTKDGVAHATQFFLIQSLMAFQYRLTIVIEFQFSLTDQFNTNITQNKTVQDQDLMS